MPTPSPLSQGKRIALILGVAIAGAFIGPYGFLLLGSRRVEGGMLRAMSPDSVRHMAAGMFRLGPVALFAACAFAGTLIFTPWFVSRLDRLAATEESPSRYYLRSALGGIMLGFFATIATSALLMFCAMLAGPPETPPGQLTIKMILFGTLFFGVMGGLSIATVAFPVIAPLGAGLGAAAAFVRNKLAGS
jgi:hypothetical protein